MLEFYSFMAWGVQTTEGCQFSLPIKKDECLTSQLVIGW